MMNSHFLKTTLVLVACLVFGLSVQAQNREMTPEKFEAHIQKLTDRLKLDKKQVRKVKKIEKDYFAKLDAVRAEYPAQQRMKRSPKQSSSDAREKPARTARDLQMGERNKQRRAKIKMVNNNHNNALKAVLTELQYEKYSSAKEDRNVRMRDQLKKAKGQSQAKEKTTGQQKAAAKKNTTPKSKAASNMELKKNGGSNN